MNIVNKSIGEPFNFHEAVSDKLIISDTKNYEDDRFDFK